MLLCWKSNSFIPELLVSNFSHAWPQAHQAAAASVEAVQRPLPNGMALSSAAADTLRAVLDHQQQQQQQVCRQSSYTHTCDHFTQHERTAARLSGISVASAGSQRL